MSSNPPVISWSSFINETKKICRKCFFVDVCKKCRNQILYDFAYLFPLKNIYCTKYIETVEMFFIYIKKTFSIKHS